MGNTRGPVFVLALCAAIGVGVLLSLFFERGDGRAARVAERGATEAAPERAELAGSASAEREAAGASASLEAGTSAPAVTAVAEPPALPMGELTGRVLDRAGRPLAGARVTLSAGVGREFTVLDMGTLDEQRELDSAPTDADGRFRFALPLGKPVDVRAELAGFCDDRESDAYAGQELELVLTPGVLVFGRVTRARDGLGVEGAAVRVFRRGGPQSLERETSTSPDGSYELRIDFREDARLEVVPELEQCPDWAELTIGPDDRCEHDVVLVDGVLVEGFVTARDGGAPIAGATVGEGWWYRRTATTDARGAYRLPGFGDPGVPELNARARGYTPAKREDLPAAVDGVMRVDFELSRARSVRGRVVDERGAPLEGVYVAAVASEFGDQGQRTDWVSTQSDAAGRYALEDLSVDLGHALFLSKAGYATSVYDFPESEFTTPELELADVVLRPPALLAGRVEDARGAPVAGVQIELQGANEDRGRLTRERRPLERARSYVDTRIVLTDARGRFWFGDLPPGTFQLRLRASGRPESAPTAITVAAGEQRSDLVLRLDQGGTIRGQVVDEHGNGLEGVYVSAQSERLPDVAAPVHVSVRTDGDGRFELEGMPPGEYTIRAYPLEVAEADPEAPFLPATAEHVASGAQPILVQLTRGASIRGQLVDAAGAPLAGYVVAALDEHGAPREYAQTDLYGNFALTVLRGSSSDLEVRGSPQTEAFQTVFLRRADVAAGTSELLLQLER